MAVLYNKANVQIGVANLFIAPANTSLPADSIDYGNAWGGDWVYVGATVEGVKFSIEPSTKNISIEESSTPALVTFDSVDISIESELAEDTLESMQLAYGAGGVITATSAGAGTIGKRELALSETLGEIAAGIDMQLRNGKWRRVLVPIMNSTGKVDTSYRRSDSARTYPIELHSICNLEDVIIREKTADAE